MLDGVRLTGTGGLTDRLSAGPAIAVIGIDAPSVAAASNTLIPVARAKVSMRIAPGDDAAAACDALAAHLTAHAPWGAQVSVQPGAFAAPFTAGRRAGVQVRPFGPRRGVGRPAVDVGAGGSIPFVTAYAGLFPDAEILITGVEDPGRARTAATRACTWPPSSGPAWPKPCCCATWRAKATGQAATTLPTPSASRDIPGAAVPPANCSDPVRLSRIPSYDVNAPFMLFLQLERGVHALRVNPGEQGCARLRVSRGRPGDVGDSAVPAADQQGIDGALLADPRNQAGPVGVGQVAVAVQRVGGAEHGPVGRFGPARVVRVPGGHRADLVAGEPGLGREHLDVHAPLVLGAAPRGGARDESSRWRRLSAHRRDRMQHRPQPARTVRPVRSAGEHPEDPDRRPEHLERGGGVRVVRRRDRRDPGPDILVRIPKHAGTLPWLLRK